MYSVSNRLWEELDLKYGDDFLVGMWRQVSTDLERALRSSTTVNVIYLLTMFRSMYDTTDPEVFMDIAALAEDAIIGVAAEWAATRYLDGRA